MIKNKEICKKDIRIFMKFLNHKTFWLHAFKPTAAGVTQLGDLKSLFSTNKDEIVKEIERLNDKGIVCLAVNEREKGKTKGADVERIGSLIFDIDVMKQRKKGYVSTKEDHSHSLNKANELRKLLEDKGFVVSLVIDSGNGSQVYCKVDLDKNPITVAKLSSFEKEIGNKLNDDIIEIDCITKDINRRMKIPGTINRKDTEQIENRLSNIVYSEIEDLQEKEKTNNIAFEKVEIESVKTSLNCKTGKLETSGTDESRSAGEYRKVISLIRQGKSKEEVFKKMNMFSKWTTAPPQYRELTYNKALEFVGAKELAKEREEKISIMNYKSLMDFEVEPVKWLIKDQIPVGEVGVLAGKRGEGKTWIALKQALGLASGKDVFADEVPEKRKVMIIDEESGEGILAKRLQLLAKADGITGEELQLISMSFTGLKLDQIETQKYSEFEEIVNDFKPDLIIVDCLQRVCGFDIDKENSLISNLFTGAIRPMMKIHNMSWLFIHHLRKSPTGNQNSSGDPLDEIRGGSELVNYCRFVLSCAQPRNQGKQEDGSMMMVFKVLKMSNSNIPEPKVLSFQPDHSDPDHSTQIKMDYLGKVEEVLKTEVRVANAIKEFLLEEGISAEFTTKQITDAETKIGFKKTFISKGLKQLVDDGFLEKVKRGIYEIIGEIKPKVQATLLPKLPYASPEKTLEEQKKDLVKTEDDINDEIIEEDLRKKKVEAFNKDPKFCPECNSPIVDNKCIGGCA